MTERADTVAAVELRALESEALGAIAAAASPDELDDARVHYLGRKSPLKLALREVRDRESGAALNARTAASPGAYRTVIPPISIASVTTRP